MNTKKSAIILLLIVGLVSMSFVYYQNQQKKQNAYKTVDEVNTNELYSNTMSTISPITVEIIEPTKTTKDLSKFEKTVTDKHTVYYHNSDTDTNVRLEHTEVRVEYKKQQGSEYTVVTKEFLTTTGKIQQYQFTTTLSDDTDKIQSKSAIESTITKAVESEIQRIKSVSAFSDTTTYKLKDNSLVTVNAEGVIQRIETDSTTIKVSESADEPKIPELESEILDSAIQEEETG